MDSWPSVQLRRWAVSTAVITATTRSRRGSGTRVTKLPNASRRRAAKRVVRLHRERISRRLDREHVAVDARVELERTRCSAKGDLQPVDAAAGGHVALAVELFRPRQERFRDQVVLRAEVAIRRAERDPGRRGDVLHLQAVVVVVAHELHRGLHDAVASRPLAQIERVDGRRWLLVRAAALGCFRHRQPRQPSSPSTRMALSRRNFGQTSSLNGTFGMSVMMRSSDRPIGK